MGTAPLAELHTHLLGCIEPDDLLDYIAFREFTWDQYEERMQRAYGVSPPLRETLDRHRNGDPGAAAEFAEIFVFGDDDAGSFERFNAKFNLLTHGTHLSAVARGDADALPLLVDEVLGYLTRVQANQAGQGIGYSEQRFMIGGSVGGEAARALLDPVLHAMTAPDAPLTNRLAISLPRWDPWPSWELAQQLALGPNGQAVTAVDFCVVEEGYPPKDKREFFAAVADFNDRHPDRSLAILYHVGESYTDKSIESAIRWVQEAAELGAHRLGHAIALGVDPRVHGEHTRTESVEERRDQIEYDLEHSDALARHSVPIDRAALADELVRLASREPGGLVTYSYDTDRLDEIRGRQDFAMERVRAAGAVVEVCPTSNRRIGGISDPSHHPVHRFLERGLPFVVSSDDPGILGVTLDDELDWVAATAGLDFDARRDLAASSWRYRSEVLSGREPRA